jgi:hypothetical protein
VVLGLWGRGYGGDKGAGGFVGAFKGEGRGSQGARSGKAGEDHGSRCAAGAARRKKGKKKEALPGGVGVSEKERGSARSEEAGQRGKRRAGPRAGEGAVTRRRKERSRPGWARS